MLVVSAKTTHFSKAIYKFLLIFVKLEFFFVNIVNALLAKTCKVTSKRVKEHHKHNQKNELLAIFFYLTTKHTMRRCKLL